ncbi:MAG: Gfo/Idh/MocA family oxidoreductase [Bryobacteraceae bacterium]|nr:Gfo/Idh/MocA family oxidoreductase [Bryobacteraceae bacterium]
MNRRDVLRTASAAATALPAISYSRVLGANDSIALGVIGCGGRGRYIMGQFLATGQARVTALCDVYAARIDEARSQAPDARSFVDHRKLLETKELDATLIATPDHWHAWTAIDAMNAGKDVYVEKPLTLKIEEGPRIVRAARVNERVCQVGMQQRSGMHYWKAKKEYIDSGRIGKITLIQTVWHTGGGPLRRRREFPREQPSNLDWARYLGPVKWRDWDPPQYFDFRRYLDFGGGKLTDFFAHWGDVVHMFMDNDNPISAVAAGGVYYYKDGRSAPDTIHMLLEYRGDFTVTFESATGANLPPYGIHVCGTQGRLFIDRKRYEFFPAEEKAPPEVFNTTEDLDRAHVENFLDCCRTRKRPNGDVYFGHRGAMAAHLGNIAYIEKRRIRFDPDREEILPL